MMVQHALPLCALNPRPTICRYFASDSVGLAICINSTSGQSNPSENKSTLTSTCTRQSQPSRVKQSQLSRVKQSQPSCAAAPSAHKQSRLCCVGNSRATPQGRELACEYRPGRPGFKSSLLRRGGFRREVEPLLAGEDG